MENTPNSFVFHLAERIGIATSESFEDVLERIGSVLGEQVASALTTHCASKCASLFARGDWTDDAAWEGKLFAFLAEQDSTPALSRWFDAGAALQPREAAGCAYALATMGGREEVRTAELRRIAEMLCPMSADELNAWLATGWLHVPRMTDYVEAERVKPKPTPANAAREAHPIKRRGLRGAPGRAAAQEHLASGFPIFVGDRTCPGRIIKISPDGRREYVTVDEKGNATVLGAAPNEKPSP